MSKDLTDEEYEKAVDKFLEAQYALIRNNNLKIEENILIFHREHCDLPEEAPVFVKQQCELVFLENVSKAIARKMFTSMLITVPENLN